MGGALAGLRVVDLSINAPGPFATMMLADMGAEVVTVLNPATVAAARYAGAAEDPFLSARHAPFDMLMRGKQSLALDLKAEAGREVLLRLAAGADVLVEEMRPGKLASLGLGYPVLSEANPGLVLCSISGYGQTGPLAGRAGHDIDYIARAGALSLCRDGAGRPVMPQNLLGDYAAGASLAVSGILAALYERHGSGLGQHVDVSMTEGALYLMADIAKVTLAAGHPVEAWRRTLGGGMPTYDVYETADARWMAVGALEPKFIAILADALDYAALPALMAEKAGWPEARAGLETRFAARDRAHWTAVFDPLDACVAPVLELADLAGDAQLAARGALAPMPGDAGAAGALQIAPAPRFSRSSPAPLAAPRLPGCDTEAVLATLGYDAAGIETLRRRGALG